jgi:hypothetical protein
MKLAQPIFSHSFLEQIVRDLEVLGQKKRAFPPLFSLFSCRFFHTQNARGPKETEGNFHTKMTRGGMWDGGVSGGSHPRGLLLSPETAYRSARQ